MARQKKKTIALSRESLSEILTEAYTEATTQRARAVNQYNKWLKDCEDKIDISSMGRAVNDILKISADATLLKLNIAKVIQSVIVKDEKDSGEGMSGNDVALTSEDIKSLELLMGKMDKKP